MTREEALAKLSPEVGDGSGPGFISGKDLRDVISGIYDEIDRLESLPPGGSYQHE